MAPRTLIDIYQSSTRDFADRPLFGVKQDGVYKWMTYGKFANEVEYFRGALARLGVRRGDTVGIISDNRVEWAIANFATLGLSARFCPMYEAQRFEDWRHIIEDSGTKVLIVANEAIDEEVAPLVDEIETLEQVIYIDGAQSEHSYQRLLGVGIEYPAEIIEPEPEEIAALIYTSGTTGKPKGVLLSHRNIVANIESMNSIELVRDDDLSLTFLPWAHAFGHTVELHLMFANGARMALVESLNTLADNLAEIRPTILFAVPRVFNRIYEGVFKKIGEENALKQRIFHAALDTAEQIREEESAGKTPGIWKRTKSNVYDNLVFAQVRERFGGRLRYAVSGGAALSPVVSEFIASLNITVLEGYGLTETAPLLSGNIPGATRLGSAGRPVPGVEIFIKESPDHPEGVGEVCARGANIMVGYHNLPDKTAEVLDEDGTFHTGDLGRIDEDGFLWILGRVKEEFKLQNGKYVAPAALEEALQLSPYIDQVIIDGANRPFPIAVINLSESAREWAEKRNINKEEITRDERIHKLIEDELTRLSKNFRSYEKPGKFVVVDEIWDVEHGQMTPSLKLRRDRITKTYDEAINALYAEQTT